MVGLFSHGCSTPAELNNLRGVVQVSFKKQTSVLVKPRDIYHHFYIAVMAAILVEMLQYCKAIAGKA